MRVLDSPLPADALLQTYRSNGAFTDCYAIDVARRVSLEAFVEAFYTTPLFKVERTLIALFLFKRTSDRDANALANGSKTAFAVWNVEQRSETQLLLREQSGVTRSWLMSEPSADTPRTRLYFGSAFVPRRKSAAGAPEYGFMFRLLLRFHIWYSRALLSEAVKRIERKATIG